MNNDFDIQLLVAYLTGNCSEKEQETVDAWLLSSNDNVLLFNDFKKVWGLTSSNNRSYIIDVDSRWDDFKSRAGFGENKEVIVDSVVKNNRIKKAFINFSKIAAVIVLLFSVYFLINHEKEIVNISYDSTVAESDSPLVLGDGSEITMNRESHLVYPKDFNKDIREVSFSGEAFFDVAHNPEQPMIISTGNVRVKVLGTSFNLCNCENMDEVTVHLETGKILFYSIDQNNGRTLEQVIVNPGEVGVYSKSTGLITKHDYIGTNHTAWKTGVLEFVNAPLQEVVSVIENTYGIEIDTRIDMSTYSLTARYENETPESIFKSLQIIYGFNYEIINDSILIH